MYTAAFMMGLLGSLHCVGMCGPIAFSLPGKGWGKLPYLGGRLLYNLGRIITYALLGGIVSLIGVGAAMFQLQQVLSILLGGMVLIWAMKEFGWVKLPKGLGLMDNLSAKVRSGFGKFFARGTVDSLFMIGLLNGLLPCGMVYMGLMLAASAGTAQEGMMTMALFGAGTFPLMFALAFGAKFVTVKMRSFVNKSVPYTLVLVGLMFVLRGMGLGIPYLSPKFHADEGKGPGVSCCHKAGAETAQNETASPLYAH